MLTSKEHYCRSHWYIYLSVVRVLSYMCFDKM
uniref:TIL n=1 Tax=Arundo donax TaxID=35708 RepID=A0A0A9EDP4_ARUDO